MVRSMMSCNQQKPEQAQTRTLAHSKGVKPAQLHNCSCCFWQAAPKLVWLHIAAHAYAFIHQGQQAAQVITTAVVCMSPCAAMPLPQHTQMPLIAWFNQSHRSHMRQNQWQLAHVTHPKAAPSEVQACDACGCTLPCCICRTGNRPPPTTPTPTPNRPATSTASYRIGFYPMPAFMCGSIHSHCTPAQLVNHLPAQHHPHSSPSIACYGEPVQARKQLPAAPAAASAQVAHPHSTSSHTAPYVLLPTVQCSLG